MKIHKPYFMYKVIDFPVLFSMNTAIIVNIPNINIITGRTIAGKANAAKVPTSLAYSGVPGLLCKITVARMKFKSAPTKKVIAKNIFA